MNSQFRCDGSYFRHFDKIPLKRLAVITEEVAWDFINNNGYGRRPQHASLDAPVLVNKEYALATVQGDRAFILNKQDDQYEIWCGPKEEILKALGREEITATAPPYSAAG